MARNIQNIKNALQFGGARPSLFEVEVTFPAALAAFQPGLNELRLHCRAAQLPAATVGVIEVPYQDRKIKLAGSRTFAEWTITVFNDEDFLIREAFLQWSNALNHHFDNVRSSGSSSEPASYKGEAKVRQLRKDEQPGAPGVRAYRFIGCWPSEVGPIELNWENNDQIEEFEVTLQYDYWVTHRDSGDNSSMVFGSEPVD